MIVKHFLDIDISYPTSYFISYLTLFLVFCILTLVSFEDAVTPSEDGVKKRVPDLWSRFSDRLKTFKLLQEAAS